MVSNIIKLTVCLLLIVIMVPSHGYKILMYCPLPTRSHHILCKGVVDILVDRGHELTMVSAFSTKNATFRDIVIPELIEMKNDNMSLGFAMLNMTVTTMLSMLTEMQPLMIGSIFKNKRFQKFFNDKSESFDVVIFEYSMNEMALGFGQKYDCPVVALCPINLMPGLAALTNNPLSLAIVPSSFTAFNANMNLKERLINTLSTLVMSLMGRFLLEPGEEALYKQYFPEESKRVPYSELVKGLSAALVNSHPSVGVVRPLLPNVVEIGGYHINEPEPLPVDLKKILDEAKHGVIYFSMGGNLNSSEMGPELQSAFLNNLAKVKETVLWKYEEDLPNKPKNLIIRKWLPQTGILAHPNVKLFISHGGLLSCTESAHFGVPQLAIPVFGDQHHNGKVLEERGNGIVLAFSNITEESFGWALKEALENPKYAEKAKIVHRLYHDRPIKPRDLLSFQVEHVVRTKGAKHLSPPKLSKCSQMLLDVMAVILIPLGLVCSLLSYACWKCCRRMQKKNKTE